MAGPQGSEWQKRRRPGVTAAATTAVLAIGAGPGCETAAPTTAALATGAGPGLETAAPTTAALPRRDARSGMSDSSGCGGCLVGFHGRDDGLDRDPALGHELSASVANRRCEARGPEILEDKDSAE